MLLISEQNEHVCLMNSFAFLMCLMSNFILNKIYNKKGHTIKPGTPELRNTEHDGIPEHEESSKITEQQNNTRKQYQYRTTTY